MTLQKKCCSIYFIYQKFFHFSSLLYLYPFITFCHYPSVLIVLFHCSMILLHCEIFYSQSVMSSANLISEDLLLIVSEDKIEHL